jgi:hypothetical protein
MSAVMKAKEFAPLVGLAPRTVLDKAKRGEIGCIRDGKNISFLQRHADEYLAKHEVPAVEPKLLPARNPRYAR